MIFLNTTIQFQNVKELLDFGFGSSDRFCKTYYDRKCQEEQCDSARRSFGDLLEICQTYFPETTKEEVAFALLSVNEITSFHCTTIGKLVFLSDRWDNSENRKKFDTRLGADYTSDFLDDNNMCFNIVEKYANDYKERALEKL